jgi:hypothetical protein
LRALGAPGGAPLSPVDDAAVARHSAQLNHLSTGTAMKYFSPYRVASYLLVLFFVGHTAGGMLAKKSLGPEADAVFASMKAVHFVSKGSTVSWYVIWFAFGLLVSVFLLFSAIAAWQLDKVSAANWPSVSVIAWALCASHACNAILSWIYFFAGPGIFATIVTILLAAGALRKQRSG